nr:MAG TPA: hypothetical protein [Caudoviricetes sp.]
MCLVSQTVGESALGFSRERRGIKLGKFNGKALWTPLKIGMSADKAVISVHFFKGCLSCIRMFSSVPRLR